MGIIERIKLFENLISTTTDPRVIEEYEKELAILLEQKSYQPRDEKGRFTSSSQPTPIQAPLEPGKDILIEKLRVPGENVIKAFEDEGCKFGISKFLMYTMSRIFLQRFKDNTNLKNSLLINVSRKVFSLQRTSNCSC
jgi:hypothetical protein